MDTKAKDIVKLMIDIEKDIDFSIVELASLGPKKQIGYSGIFWAEDEDGNKYWEAFGIGKDKGKVLRYADIKMVVHSMSRYVATCMVEKTCKYSFMLDKDGHLHDSKADPEPVKISKIYLTKPKDWPDMNESKYHR